MTTTILFSAHEKHYDDWLPALRNSLEGVGVDANVVKIAKDPGLVDYVVHSPDGPIADFRPFLRLRAILSLWAGVEDVIHNPTINVPLVRMVDPGMIEGMTEWVTGQVLRHHLGFDAHITNRNGKWLKHLSPPLARNRTIGMLGVGSLGTACAFALRNLNFRVLGWSRARRQINGVEFFCGEEGLPRILGLSDIICLLLPLTPETENTISQQTLKFVKPGAVIINSGRGALIDDDALLEALNSGRVSHATLDVFRQEPLPAEHPFWNNEKISIWPHIASETRTETASMVIAQNIRRHLEGRNLQNVVDIGRGY